MPTQTLLPDALIAHAGWAGSPVVTTIDEDPDTAGGDWLDPVTASGSGSSSPTARVSFPTPTGNPSGVQTFKARLGLVDSLGKSPTARIDLFEGGALKAAGAEQTIASTKLLGGEVISQTFDLATTPLTTADGSGVEALVVVTASSGPTTGRRSASLDSVNWDTVNYSGSVAHALVGTTAGASATTGAVGVTSPVTAYSIWNRAVPPSAGTIGHFTDNPVSLGTVFTVAEAVTATAISFYFAAGWSTAAAGPSAVALYASGNPTALASASHNGSRVTGWNDVAIPNTALVAGTKYVAVVFYPAAYPAESNYFTTAQVVNGPLTAPNTTDAPGQGRATYGASIVNPTSTFSAGSYFSDVVVDVAASGVTHSVAGTTAGASATSGALRLTASLTGASAGSASTTAVTTVARPLAGVTTGASSTTAALASAGQAALAGVSSGASTTTGALVSSAALASTSTATSTTSAALTLRLPLSGTSTGTASTTGAITIGRGLAGATAGASTTTAAVTATLGLTGVTTGISATTGAARVAVTLTGSTAGLSTTTGTLAGSGGLAGSTIGSSTTTAGLRLAAALNGTSVGSSTTLGGFSGATILVTGLTAGSSATSGLLGRLLPLGGGTAGLSTSTGALGLTAALTAVTAGQAATAAAVAVTYKLAGATGGASTTSGATRVTFTLTGVTTGADSTIAAIDITGDVNAIGVATASSYRHGTATHRPPFTSTTRDMQRRHGTVVALTAATTSSARPASNTTTIERG